MEVSFFPSCFGGLGSTLKDAGSMSPSPLKLSQSESVSCNQITRLADIDVNQQGFKYYDKK